jgi:hypothetical protein
MSTPDAGECLRACLKAGIRRNPGAAAGNSPGPVHRRVQASQEDMEKHAASRLPSTIPPVLKHHRGPKGDKFAADHAVKRLEARFDHFLGVHDLNHHRQLQWGRGSFDHQDCAGSELYETDGRAANDAVVDGRVTHVSDHQQVGLLTLDKLHNGPYGVA